ncbi:heavy-metal-associated domain-containing protein [Flavobacteriaceae bacterium GSB9]|nr:heavy-metal-associated domain-containing protein [Flavobacteriaceae bacterium GSB9]
MSLLSENVIPGHHGKIFETDATKDDSDKLETIKKFILKIPGVKKVFIDTQKFPVQIAVYTSAMVKVDDIENAVKKTGHHAIPKGLFKL